MHYSMNYIKLHIDLHSSKLMHKEYNAGHNPSTGVSVFLKASMLKLMMYHRMHRNARLVIDQIYKYFVFKNSLSLSNVEYNTL